MYDRIITPKQGVNKARHQCGVWVSTDEIIVRLSRQLDMSKTEVIHLAVVEMERFYAKLEEDR